MLFNQKCGGTCTVVYWCVHVPWYIGVYMYHGILVCTCTVVYWCVHVIPAMKARVLIPPLGGTLVLQQDTLSILLLSTQVHKWVPDRLRTSFVA